MDNPAPLTAGVASDDNQCMTSSYHEIVDKHQLRFEDGGAGTAAGGDEKSLSDVVSDLDIPKAAKQKANQFFSKARHWVGELSTDGSLVTQEEGQITYVVQDLTDKIRSVNSPTKSLGISSDGDGEEIKSKILLDESCDEKNLKDEDLNLIINEIESEAKKLAFSVDNLTENLSGILHSISSMSLDCTYIASDSVASLTDTADASIKVMYQVMAKCEELNKACRPIYHVHQEIKNTKRLLDRVEAEVNS